ncbi:MAG TPA: vitamin K epoxide reductase family protein [Bryobacteraceae bacterium]|jgi:uncharacterized membrane protein|nr:vitamin K epoxide reductase family protein [Bryobacteraceae bacterium]
MSEPNRAVAVLSLVSVGVLGMVTAFQLGAIEHLPGPKRGVFDADTVHGSREAYALFGVPDGLLGMASYGTTAALAELGARHLTFAKTALDTLVAAGFGIFGWRRLHALSIYSLAAGTASVVSLVLAARTRP